MSKTFTNPSELIARSAQTIEDTKLINEIYLKNIELTKVNCTRARSLVQQGKVYSKQHQAEMVLVRPVLLPIF